MADSQKANAAPELTESAATAGLESGQSAGELSRNDTPVSQLDNLIAELDAALFAGIAKHPLGPSPSTQPPSDEQASGAERGLDRTPCNAIEAADSEDSLIVPMENETVRGDLARHRRVRGSGRWAGSRIRQMLTPAAILTAMAGIGAMLLSALMPGTFSTTVVVTDAPSGTAAGHRERDEQQSALEERIEVDRQTRPVQAQTVRIFDTSDQPKGTLTDTEMPPVGPVDPVATGQNQPDTSVGVASERAMEPQVRTERSGARWSDAAVENRSVGDRLQVGGGESAPLEEAMSEPLAAEHEDRTEMTHSEGDVQLRASIVPATVTIAANMRERPTNDAAVAMVVPAGKRVGVFGCEAWCEVVFEGQRGWIHRSLVSGAGFPDPGLAGATGPQITPGMPLISGDGAQLGTIRDLIAGDSGEAMVVVALSRELSAAVPLIRLRAERLLTNNEHAKINITRERFLRSLSTKASAVTAAR